MLEKPNDRRNFVHKRLFGAATSFVTSGFNPISAVSSFVRGPTVGQSFATRRTAQSVSRGCPPGQRLTSGGNCVRDTSVVRTRTPGISGALQRMIPGGATGFEVPAGDAVMGRFGAALEPFEKVRSISTCLPGMVLGMDGFCYDKRAITNRERMWPKGTAPLLTGGDMSCIRKAARAAGRLQRTTKRLQKIGLLKR